MKQSTVKDCRMISLPKEGSDRGSLSHIASNGLIPFDIKRVYYTYDIPSGAERGGHAHIEQHEYVVSGSGSFTIIVDDGKEKKSFFLNSPNKGLYIAPGIWRELLEFSSGSIVLVMASGVYDEADYIREYSDFKELK